MASNDKELEARLTKAGNSLLSPPSSLKRLLHLLKRLDSCLVRVSQSPGASMQKALGISLKALVNKELFDNKDTSVRVYVASCLIEVTRISAPDPPCGDATIERILRLIVAAFDNLWDSSHCLYAKKVSILRSFSKVRLFLLMVDFQCDDLIVDMFKHFLNSIRDHHPDDVYSSMGFVMILVLEESDEIPLEVVSTLLDFVKKEKKKVSPKAWKLAKRVIDNCSWKLAPYMFQAVEQKGFPLEDYSKLVNFVCQLQELTCYGPDSCEEDDLAALQEAIFANVCQPSSAESSHEMPVNTHHESGSDWNFLDDSASISL